MAKVKVRWVDSETAAAHQVPAANGAAGVVWEYVTWGILTITSASSPYTVAGTIDIVLCNAAGGAITVNLPAANTRTGRKIVVKKIDSSNNNVTVDGNGAETIDGALTQVLKKQWESITMYSDGSSWYIV